MTTERRPHTDAVLAAVSTIECDGNPVPVGDADGEHLDAPYFVVYPIPTPTPADGTLDDDDEVGLVYQVTSVGVSRHQAEWLADQAHAALATLTVPDRRVLRVIGDLAGGARPDPDAHPTLFTVPDRYRLWTAPA